MENSYQQENSYNHPQQSFRSFSKIAVSGIMLVVLQHVAISPLDNGQLQTHLYFQKPILTFTEDPIKEELQTNATISALPEDPIKEDLQTNASQKLQPLPTAWPKKAEQFFPFIIKAATEHEIDPALVKAIIMAESGYNPKAISKKGATGLMQLMPGTAESLGVEDIFNAEHNINGGVLYFKRLKDLFEGDVKLALAAYNAGARKVKMYQGIPPFKATRYYIKNVFKYYEHYRQQMTSDMNQP